MNQSTEFAEQYTTTERLRLVALFIVSGFAIVALSKIYFFPSLNAFAESAHCRTILGLDGLAVLWYGLFVGMPLLCAMLVAGVIGFRGYRILRDSQTPPIGEKVFRPTRIIRGTKAKWFGLLQLLSCTPFLVIMIWGFPQATSMLEHAKSKPVNCSATSSIRRDAYAKHQALNHD
jgi:hypothetical protein